MCEFVTQCQNIQKIHWSSINQTTQIATSQRICNTKIMDEIETEADKENTVPVIKTSLSESSRVVKNCSKQRGKHVRNNVLSSSKKRIRAIITADNLDREVPNNLPAVPNLIAKQENVNSNDMNSQSRSSAMTLSINESVCTLIERLQSDKLNTRRETKASSLSLSSGNQIELNRKDECNLTMLSNKDWSFHFDTGGDTKIANISSMQNDKAVVQEALMEVHRIVHKETICNMIKNRNSFGKISELISKEQKSAIEMGYRIDMALVDSEQLEKNIIILDKKNIKCNICAASYSRMDKCKVHIMSHLKMKPFKCIKCDFSTVTVTNIRTHIRKSHLKIKPFTCDLCEKHFMTAALLQEHLNTHTGARPFKCQICNFACANRQVLSCHNMTHKPSKDISCKTCGKMFYSAVRMRAHMQIHKKDKGLTCNICKARLSKETALQTHMKNVHSRNYICNICNKELTCRKAWHNHQNVHAKAKYQCVICPNVYKSKHILEEHLLKHEGIRKYKCTICEKSFGQQSHLAAHTATHSEARFACPGCKKLFNRHDNMKMHTKRCRLFLEKPELANIFTPRVHIKSINKSVKSNTIQQNETPKFVTNTVIN